VAGWNASAACPDVLVVMTGVVVVMTGWSLARCWVLRGHLLVAGVFLVPFLAWLSNARVAPFVGGVFCVVAVVGVGCGCVLSVA
jgi:hypothetical protein